MVVKRVVVGGIGTNCYIVGSSSKEAAVIDPGANADLIMAALKEEGLKAKTIILTHGHYDHIGAVKDLVEKTCAKVCLHGQDGILLAKPGGNLSTLFGRAATFDFEIREVDDGDVIELGDLSFEVIHTPGHTPGSISLKLDDLLFTGDLLFAGSVGRTDFPYGSYEVLKESLERVASLPDEVKVLPGHGDPSTIGREKISNPFLLEIFG
ncbi:MAG: MBL fold metallo-hydrolase [Actinomycetota bacterium]|nr:MBL fold metallo-hydrolase [Actinomycetota bacterium]